MKRDRGASLLEYLILLPILVTAVIGGIDAAGAYNQNNDVGAGAQKAATDASLGWIPPDTRCALHGRPGNETTQAMICQTKNHIGLDNAEVFVSIRLVDASVEPVSYGDGNYVVGPKHHILICAQTPLSSATGVFSSLMGGHWIQERAEMPIQALTDPPPVQGEEALPEGTDWNFCF